MEHCNRYRSARNQSSQKKKYLKSVLDAVVLDHGWKNMNDPYMGADGQRKRAIHVVEHDRAMNVAYWTEIQTRIQAEPDSEGRQFYLEIVELKLLKCRNKYLPSLRFAFP